METRSYRVKFSANSLRFVPHPENSPVLPPFENLCIYAFIDSALLINYFRLIRALYACLTPIHTHRPLIRPYIYDISANSHRFVPHPEISPVLPPSKWTENTENVKMPDKHGDLNKIDPGFRFLTKIYPHV